MGQGQEIIARRLLATATAEGQWLLLQNTHLGLGYLAEVCNLCWRVFIIPTGDKAQLLEHSEPKGTFEKMFSLT